MDREILINKSKIVLIVFSFIYLLLSSGKLSLLLKTNIELAIFSISCIAAMFFLYLNRDYAESEIFIYLLFAYIFMIMLSYLMHYNALEMLNPLTYITVRHDNAAFGMSSLKLTTIIYLLFPVLLIMTINIIWLNYNHYKILYILPIIFIPSALVGMYQSLVDIQFLNVPYFAGLNRVSGLGSDANSFGISSYLLFSICALGILQIESHWKRLSLFGLAAVFLWCIFLSGSRTGFLGVVIFVVILPWMYVWANSKLPKTKRSFLLFCPLGVVICLAVIILVFQGIYSSSHSPVLTKKLQSSYLDFKKGGMKEVIQKSKRSHFWLQAYRLTSESPISGWGPGGFVRNLDNIRYKYNESPRIKFIDNACNHYLQMSSELGLVGATFNTFIIAFPLWMVYRVRNRIQDQKERLLISFSATNLVIMMLLFTFGHYAMALDTLWLYVILLSFLFVTGTKYGYIFRFGNFKIFLTMFAICALIFLVGTFEHSLGRNGYEAVHESHWWPYKYERNCYSVEQWESGRIRWCGQNAFLQIPITKPFPDVIKLSLIAHHPDIESKALTVKYGGKGGVEHEMILNDHSWKTIAVPTTSDYIFDFEEPNKQTKSYLVISLDVSRTWIPKKWGWGTDERELGLAVLLPSET